MHGCGNLPTKGAREQQRALRFAIILIGCAWFSPGQHAFPKGMSKRYFDKSSSSSSQFGGSAIALVVGRV